LIQALPGDLAGSQEGLEAVNWTRRATGLDALEPSACASVSRGTLEKLGLKPGDMLRVTTQRGEVELASSQDDAIPDGVVFIPSLMSRRRRIS
jgi:predicted molibdopterin-dependent oxidoreductase YjgC